MSTSKNTPLSPKMSLAKWLKEQQGLSETYQNETRQAEQTYHQSKSGYGLLGEALAQKGLSQSGYSDYLTGLAFATRQSSRDKALAAKISATQKGYADYLRAYESQRLSASKSSLSALLSKGITDPDDAYAFSLSQGLSEEDARKISQLAISISQKQAQTKKDDLRIQVINRLISYGMTKEKGAEYAMQYGFSPEEAQIIGEAAAEFYNAKDMGFKEFTYQDYLSSWGPFFSN